MIHPIIHRNKPDSITDFIRSNLFNTDMNEFKDGCGISYYRIGHYNFSKNGLQSSINGTCTTFFPSNRSIDKVWLQIIRKNKFNLDLLERALINKYIALFAQLTPTKQIRNVYYGKPLIKLTKGK